jgi:hypothetical protein
VLSLKYLAFLVGMPSFTEVEPTIAVGLDVPVVGFNTSAVDSLLVDQVSSFLT